LNESILKAFGDTFQILRNRYDRKIIKIKNAAGISGILNNFMQFGA